MAAQATLLLTFAIGIFLGATIEGRLTEFGVDRLPILSHNLQHAKIDLNLLSERALLGPRSQFKLHDGGLHKTAKGGQRARLVQTYGGYEVQGPTAFAEMDMDGFFTGHLYGDVARNLHWDVPDPEACRRDVKTLLDRAIRSENLHPDDADIKKRDGTRFIMADPDKHKARIVYVIEFLYMGPSGVSFPVYYIDACEDAVLFSFSKIQNVTASHDANRNRKWGSARIRNTRVDRSLRFNSERSKVQVSCNPSAAGVGGNPNTGTRTYNTDPLCLPVEKNGATCTMQSVYAKVVDNQNTKDEDRDTAITFPCDVGYSDPVNGAYGVANDALFYGEMSGQFFKRKYGEDALTFRPRLVVHYGSGYENAFWTGKDMFFGDGVSYFYPLVSLDVVAHELAHGVTTRYSDLMYFGQSGGINEAFSDITGVVTRLFVEDDLEWDIGGDLMKSGSGALRYMSNPPKDGKSIKNAWLFFPFMDVHHSSGVFNYAFYKMVTDEEMDVYAAYYAFFIANKGLWGKLTRFRKGACNTVQGSYDDGSDYKAVRRAFRATWIPLILCWHSALKTTLFPGETRKEILVSKHRSPIFEIAHIDRIGAGVKVEAEDSSVIKITAGTDDDVDDIIAYGENQLKFPGNHTRIYLQLKSEHQTDVKVTLNVF